MSYQYQTERQKLFTETGVEMIAKVRDNVRELLRAAGAFRSQWAWKGVTGDTWMMLAALDYLVEKGEIREVNPGTYVGQHRLFVGKD